MANSLFEIHINNVMPHKNNVFKTASYMDMAKMCANPSSKYALPHCKCVLYCCVKCSRIDFQSPESYQHNSNVIPNICVHVYQFISSCTVIDRHPFNENKQCQLCGASRIKLFPQTFIPEKILS